MSNTGQIDASTLALIDGGKLADEINDALQIATANTFKYGSDEKVRKVVITLQMKLVGDSNEIALTGNAKPSLPTPEAFAQKCKADAKGNLFFNLPGVEGEVEDDDREAA